MTAFAQIFTNNAVALLDADISASDLTIQVQPGFGALFPNPTAAEFFLVTLESSTAPLAREIVKCVGRTGDTLIVDPAGRGWEGTTAAAWLAGSTLVDHRVTAGTLRSLQGNFGRPTTGLSIPVGGTQEASALDVTTKNKSCKWIITIQTADGRITMAEIIAVWKGPPLTPRFNVYARVGDNINFSVNVIGTPTEMKLEISNNDTSHFTDVSVIRLQHFV